MANGRENKNSSSKAVLYFLDAILIVSGLVWTVALVISLIWNIHENNRFIEDGALIYGRAAFQKDILYRRWNASHGGVYVQVSETAPPNPYLKDLTTRDVTTTTGLDLTLINPAYMVRQVFDLQKNTDGTISHITSLNPIRPENAANDWETEALLAFEKGEDEVYSIETINGESFFVYMAPLITEEGCLKCHEDQGYDVGQVRGGISETIPLEPIQDVNKAFRKSTIYGHLFIWFFGISGIVIFGRRFRTIQQKQMIAEQKLLHLSTHDSLTGIYNRAYLEEMLKDLSRDDINPISVISIDIDNLKNENDLKGHKAGDDLIIRSADLLQNCIRDTDLLFRIGGDEFLIILPKTDVQQSQLVIDRIRRKIKDWNDSNAERKINLSLGSASSKQVDTIPDIVHRADEQMYMEKRAKKKNS